MKLPNQTYTKLRSIALLGAIGLMLSGCVVHTRGRAAYRANASFRYQPAHVVVKRQPPPVRVAQARPIRPSSAAVWVEGHWSWQDRWVWVDGRWVVPERPNHVWVKPVAEARVDGSFVYHRGYWRARSERPAAVYVAPADTREVDARATVTTRPARVRTTRRVQVNVTPVAPPRPSVRASGHVRVSGSAQTNGSATTRRPTTVSTTPPKATTTAPTTVRTTAPRVTTTAPTTSAGSGTSTTSGSPRVPIIVNPKPNTTVRASSTHSGTGTATAPEGLKCSIKATSVATGGYLTLQGQGLTNVHSVQVNGKSVPLFSKRDNMISAKVTPGTTSGMVSLTTNKKKTFSCGRVTIK